MKPGRSGSGSGFTLLEVLLAVVLLLLVLTLLLQGVRSVTETVSQGTRVSEQVRRLNTVCRVMREDLEEFRVSQRWPVWVGDPSQESLPALALAFLRHDPDRNGETDSEWIQYWREPHEDEERLEQWVRYSSTGDNRGEVQGEWWPDVPPAAWQREILLDDLITADWTAWEREGVVSGVVTNRIVMVEMELAATSAPLAVVATPAASPLRRLREEDGQDLRFRAAPRVGPGPLEAL